MWEQNLCWLCMQMELCIDGLRLMPCSGADAWCAGSVVKTQSGCDQEQTRWFLCCGVIGKCSQRTYTFCWKNHLPINMFQVVNCCVGWLIPAVKLPSFWTCATAILIALPTLGQHFKYIVHRSPNSRWVCTNGTRTLWKQTAIYCPCLKLVRAFISFWLLFCCVVYLKAKSVPRSFKKRFANPWSPTLHLWFT